MKAFAVDKDCNVVELVFRSIDEIDNVFNDVFASGRHVAEIKDATGKNFVLDTSFGYSRNRSDFDRSRLKNRV